MHTDIDTARTDIIKIGNQSRKYTTRERRKNIDGRIEREREREREREEEAERRTDKAVYTSKVLRT